MRFLRPDRFVSRVTAIEPAELVEAGFDAVLVDLDNTLKPRDRETVPEDIAAWVRSLTDAGLEVCLLSNNWHGTVSGIADDLGIHFVSKAVKPLPFSYLIGLRRMGRHRRGAVMIGDQIFTDVLGARLVGIPVWAVPPLAAHDLPHTLFLRRVERLLVGELVAEDAADMVGDGDA